MDAVKYYITYYIKIDLTNREDTARYAVYHVLTHFSLTVYLRNEVHFSEIYRSVNYIGSRA